MLEKHIVGFSNSSRQVRCCVGSISETFRTRSPARDAGKLAKASFLRCLCSQACAWERSEYGRHRTTTPAVIAGAVRPEAILRAESVCFGADRRLQALLVGRPPGTWQLLTELSFAQPALPLPFGLEFQYGRTPSVLTCLREARSFKPRTSRASGQSSR